MTETKILDLSMGNRSDAEEAINDLTKAGWTITHIVPYEYDCHPWMLVFLTKDFRHAG